MNGILQNSSAVFMETFLGKVSLGFLLFGLAIFTVLGNLLVLYAIRTEKRLRTVSNLFILSLAFADLVVGLLVMPLSAAHIISGRWPFSKLICQMWLSVDYVASTASIFNLVLLSLDRYWAVVHPLLYLQNRTRKRATNFIIIVWFISFLWAPAIIFWSQLVPKHSESIKPTECDTSFRSNKLFKTSTALVNFYLPLLTIIIISCRIMVAIRSRSTMEFGRRISSATQKQMRQERTLTNTSFIRRDTQTYGRKDSTQASSEDIDEQRPSVSIVVNPCETVIKNADMPSSLSDGKIMKNIDDNDSLWEYKSAQSHTNSKSQFRLSQSKPMTLLFSSLSSSKDSTKRQSEDIPRRYAINVPILKNSNSVAKNMKYSDTVPNHFDQIVPTSTLSKQCPSTMLMNSNEQQQLPLSTEKLLVHSEISPFSSSPTNIISSNSYLDVPLTSDHTLHSKMNIITFFDYIINPSLSSSLQKELKAARQLGMLVGVFTVTWLPYFILFLVVAWCHQCVSGSIYTASIWLGYLNSTFNPLIYPLCNVHFRRAFKKILYCQHAKTKLPNLNALRELHALHSIRQRR